MRYLVDTNRPVRRQRTIPVAARLLVPPGGSSSLPAAKHFAALGPPPVRCWQTTAATARKTCRLVVILGAFSYTNNEKIMIMANKKIMILPCCRDLAPFLGVIIIRVRSQSFATVQLSTKRLTGGTTWISDRTPGVL